jgi:carbonic anhydrase
MKKIASYSTIALASLFLLSACSTTGVHTEEASAHNTKHWGYSAYVGPSHWSTLDTKFHICSEGNRQSPINIVPTSDIELPALNLNYTTGSQTIVNNGHTVQVNIKDGSVFDIDGVAYKLKQFHFHTPSENNINGTSFPLEAHFVHATDDGKLAVIAVMFEEGAENPVVARLWNRLPKLEIEKPLACGLSSQEVNSLMPTDKEYYKFMGSLTTPPCSEEVKWHVYKTPLTISKEQVETFYKLYGHSNNRPIQETNTRVIEE